MHAKCKFFANNFFMKNKSLPLINQRIIDFMKLKGLNTMELAQKLGYTSNSEISRIQNGKKVTDIFIRRLQMSYPGLNLDWLNNGIEPIEHLLAAEPSAYFNTNDQTSTIILKEQNARLMSEITLLKRIIDSQDREIRMLTEKVSDIQARTKHYETSLIKKP